VSLFEKLQAAKNKKIAATNAEGEAFLKHNATQDGVMVLESGVQYKILIQGSATQKPNIENSVKCHYHGMLINGTVFDSSVQRNTPAIFAVNAVIEGWRQGIQLMTEGSKFCFYIPSHLAYCDRQIGAHIAPGSTLIFEVELLQIL
jgi:FKBP-type peptidyl-prolyl cis-trans isomerase FklB